MVGSNGLIIPTCVWVPFFHLDTYSGTFVWVDISTGETDVRMAFCTGGPSIGGNLSGLKAADK